ncbi:CDP-glycerol glycerophosphotransferase family protein [Enterococcus sp. BWB1-3]|uniref:CDP-glycerol glycerophosphotransferase family protein n=1 Tax=Enterococcus sp. BWB1-3 TaxID=2787713 RepID=UPI001921A83C|nr:CDP-glycerol glycerophosphotransferase family protein [Enterococcus sp. BWB1-3]MBL1229939.1 CDP-glycerol glycerophosphotransferase family protein [Enterococcus sp. BWB1-3]
MKKFRRRIEHLYHLFVQVVFSILGALPKKRLFFFESFHGKQYSDNPRAIYEYLQKEYPEIPCLWAVKKGFEKPFIENNVPYVRRLGLKWLLIMPRAKYWIFNTRMPAWMKKNEQTIYIQTWHGTPLKKLGLDIENISMPGTTTKQYRKNFENEAARWDYLLSANAFSSNIFKNAFNYQGEILEIGYPRNDILLDKKHYSINKQRVLKNLGLSERKKIILYAPTWRDTEFYSKGAYKYINHFPFDQVLKNSENSVILFRAHYLIANQLDSSKYDNRVIDCSNYPDIKDLYLISDLLITDYSSVIFDFAYTERPILFFMYDQQDYLQNIRGCYLNLEKILPGPIIKTQEELTNKILELIDRDFITVNTHYEKFKETFCPDIKISSSEHLINKLFKNK